MRFSLGQLDVAEKVGIGYFFTFGNGVFGDKEEGIGTFNTFGGKTGFTSTLCQAEKFVGGGDFPSRFFGAGLESVERVCVTCNGVGHRVRGGNQVKYDPTGQGLNMGNNQRSHGSNPQPSRSSKDSKIEKE